MIDLTKYHLAEKDYEILLYNKLMNKYNDYISAIGFGEKHCNNIDIFINGTEYTFNLHYINDNTYIKDFIRKAVMRND